MVSIKIFGTIDKVKAQDMGCELLDEMSGFPRCRYYYLCALKTSWHQQPCKNQLGWVICEGANGPTTPDCDELIKAKNIYLIPDFLCNAGGVTCSYFEQVQCNMNYFWSKEEVLEKLDYKMTSAFHAVHNLAKEKGLYMRDAAYVIAINRVAEAVKLRGWV